MKKVVIAGASGLVGSHLLRLLNEQPEVTEIVLLVRTLIPGLSTKVKQIMINFDKLSSYGREITGDAVYCCLGTTRKKTPDLNTYYKIDHDYPVELAKLASRNGINQYHLISAMGANANSSIFYNRVKGETERDIGAVNLPSTLIYRPSLITGNRLESRPFEKVAAAFMSTINPFLWGPLEKYKSIEAETIAQAMVNQTFYNKLGIQIFPSNIIKRLA
ncbi:NAD-dependent epimerase/dehydratase family protein [Pedobacter sp. SYSU D00535]|uniref:NAD-dependent epimerase/dehydratase family protein n=1 Tax=Pedobacter sp. SYSU D00535 TaxID=2810308 RepID=UPI001A978388|nr:NAD-dependent epimerase/dehydratase family protein [Pedobacter sp. SYSU D00535]